MIIELITYTLLSIVVLMIISIVFMLCRFSYSGISIKTLSGTNKFKLNELVVSSLNAEYKSNLMSQEYANNTPLMPSTNNTSHSTEKPAYLREDILIPYKLSDTDKEIIKDFYR